MKIKKIEEETNNEAQLALNLIEYNKEFDPAMKYVFGQTFICSTSEIARKIAYGGYKFKCVNLDGDIFDPNGLMTGGAVNNKDSILKRVVELIFLILVFFSQTLFLSLNYYFQYHQNLFFL